MNEDDKAVHPLPETPGQQLLDKVDKRDKVIRIIELMVMFVIVIFNIFTGMSIKQIINQNQKDSLERSAQATHDRQEQKDYIKCVLLIRYDVPPEQLTTRAGTERALDLCARNGKN